MFKKNMVTIFHKPDKLFHTNISHWPKKHANFVIYILINCSSCVKKILL